jgi:DNA-directed RNA polymerase specialized sigma24 family protein
MSTGSGRSLNPDAADSKPVGQLAFAQFMADAEPKLRRAFITRYGPEVGREVTADALAYGWEHWGRIQVMRNPVGYLFRVGQSAARRHHRAPRPVVDRPAMNEHDVEPGLASGLFQLSERQRMLVMLVHGYGYSIAEAASIAGISKASAQRHMERGLAKLRAHLEVDNG